MSEILAKDTGENWECIWICERCGSKTRSGEQDLEADSFKISGYHFDGSAICSRKLYLVCPSCTNVQFLTEGQIATVPYLLNRQGEAHYEARRKREIQAGLG